MTLQYLDKYRADLLRRWWTSLQPRAEGQERDGAFAMFTRADRAQLRRCADPGEVLLQSAFQRLLLVFGKEPERSTFQSIWADPTALALLAGVLAHVKTDVPDGASFAATLGAKGEGSRPAMSELRFQRLQTSSDEADFYRQMLRAVELAGSKADVVSLANDILAWVWEYRDGHEQQPAKRLKVRWATDYYSAAL